MRLFMNSKVDTLKTGQDNKLSDLKKEMNTIINALYEDIATYAREVIPYWQGKTIRERIFNHVPQEWLAAYQANRRSGHTHDGTGRYIGPAGPPRGGDEAHFAGGLGRGAGVPL